MIQTQYQDEARKKLILGVGKIARAVKITLGPSGKNVLIKKRDSKATVTKDGVTVAKHFEVSDPVEMIAVEMIQDVADNTDSKVGDGTTTATILAEAIFDQINAYINSTNNKYVNYFEVKQGVEVAMLTVVKSLDDMSMNCEKNDFLGKSVAHISSNGDQVIADTVFDAFLVAGREGIVNIKKALPNEDTHLTTVKGMHLDMGFMDMSFSGSDGTTVMKDPLVFLYNESFNEMEDNIEKLLSHCSEKNRPLLIICDEISPMIKSMLVTNKLNGAINVCVCKSPGIGTERVEFMKDLAVITGGTVYTHDAVNLSDFEFKDFYESLGVTKEAIIKRNTASFKWRHEEGHQEYPELKEEVELRAEQIRQEIDRTKTEYEKNLLKMRLSKMTEGIAYINIAALSEQEFEEKQARISDALHSIKAAYLEGVVPGGGKPLLKISTQSVNLGPNRSTDFYGGAIALLKAISAPFYQILINAGVQIDQETINKILENDKSGFDAKKKVFVEDMFEAGIVDPVKVTKTALQNAVSIIGTLLTTDCVIYDEQAFSRTIYNTTQL